MRRLTVVTGLLLLLGCASFRDAIDQDMLYLRMCGEAEKAWDAGGYEDANVSKDFERGFMDGYVAVAFGATGCPPTLPHRHYWHPRFKNDAGKARIADWYNGYAAGAATGLTNGVSDRNRLPIAQEMYGRNQPKTGSSSEIMLPEHPLSEPVPPEPTPIPAAPAVIEPATFSADAEWRPSPSETTGKASVDLSQPAAAEVSGEFGLSQPE